MTTNHATRPASSLLTPAEVAAVFRVDPKTVTRWAKAGKLNSIRTLGGHRRYLAAEILAKLTETGKVEDSLQWAVREIGEFRAG
jgi:excisionase family DNA binding protein